MKAADIKFRTRAYALRSVKLAGSFPKNNLGDVIGRQLIKSSTSVAANYRAACSARSKADFINKLGIVEEEADETLFWIEFSADAGLTKTELITDLLKEGKEILSIVVASKKTAKANRMKAKK